jgi:signal transduction histidine kinase
MTDPENSIAAAITRAQGELAEALSELERITSVGPGSVVYAAHALNNYLCVTGAAVELISKRLSDHPDPQIQVWLDGLAHATDLMANLVAQMMNASVAGTAELRFERIDLALSVERFCDFYRRAARQKQIQLLFESTADVPAVRADRIAILSVLDNLVTNAIKYSSPGKSVWLRVRRENDSVVCEVRDEGPGLSGSDQARLFQKGARLTPRPTAGESSTGYGLAVAKDLMARLEGEIWCETVLGQGTAFFVRLPVFSEATEAGNA